MELFSDGSGEDRQQASQLRKVENEKLSIAKQTSIDQITDHIESTSEEKDAFTIHSQSKQNSEALNEGESMNSIAKEGKANTERRIKKAAPDNKNISVEAKATQNLEEARLALNRLEDVVHTVRQNRKTAASVSDTVASSAEGTQSAADKESRVTNRKARRSRRGETGQKLSSNDADGKEDSAKAVITEEIKIPRPKGEPMYMSKNGPSVDKVLSKNTREIPSADEMFEDRKEDKPFGPKHTPPLESKHVFSRTNNCASMGGKKRKGEVFALNCLPQVPSTEGEEVTKEPGVSTSEFSEAEMKQEIKGEINLPLQSDSETMSVVNTSFDEMSATGSLHSSSTNDSLETEAAEKQGMKTTDAKVLVNSDERSEDRNVGSKLKSKFSEQSEMITDMRNGCVAASKLSDCQTKRQHTVASAKKLSAKEAEKAEDKTPPLETEPIGKESEDVARLSRGSSRASKRSVENKQTKSHLKMSASASLEGDYNNEDKRKVKPSVATLKSQQKSPELKTSRAATSQKIKDGAVKEVDYIHKVGAGSSVFETSFLNVPTSGSLQELGDEECKHIEGVQALVVRNRYFSAWLSLDTKNIE